MAKRKFTRLKLQATRQVGSVPVEFIASIDTGDKVSRGVVLLNKNYKKKSFVVKPNILMMQFTGNDAEDIEMLKTYIKLILQARDEGLKWKEQIEAAGGEDDDPDQMRMTFDEDSGAGEASGDQ